MVARKIINFCFFESYKLPTKSTHFQVRRRHISTTGQDTVPVFQYFAISVDWKYHCHHCCVSSYFKLSFYSTETIAKSTV